MAPEQHKNSTAIGDTIEDIAGEPMAIHRVGTSPKNLTEVKTQSLIAALIRRSISGVLTHTFNLLWWL